MKKWNKPELAVVEIKETSVNHNKLGYNHYEEGYCTAANMPCPKGNGKGNKNGICNNCQYCNCDSSNLENFS